MSRLEAREVQPRRSARRFVLPALVALVAAGISVGFAFAKASARRVGSGVVVIETNLAYGGGQAAGTGIVLSSSGEVLTNNHVIRGARAIKVVVPRTGRSYTATVVGYDVSDDVAVLHARGASNLRTVSLGSSRNVRLGQSVRAVGNAGGTGSLSSASGRITGLARAITISDDSGGSERLTGLIETNAALRAGDSGGPLLDAAGRVIGMDTAASVGSGFGQVASADGYAIPINKALAVVGRINSGKASATVHIGKTAFLGVQVTANGHSGSGAVVAGVVPGSPAAAAGLVRGDLIISFAGHRIGSPATLGPLVAARNPGARVSLGFLDGSGSAYAATVTLASGPPQ